MESFTVGIHRLRSESGTICCKTFLKPIGAYETRRDTAVEFHPDAVFETLVYGLLHIYRQEKKAGWTDDLDAFIVEVVDLLRRADTVVGDTMAHHRDSKGDAVVN
jgi:hypothetical protein